MPANRVRAAILAAGAAVPFSMADAAVFTATWTGAGGTSSYSDPANWSVPGNPGAVPIDDATNQFNVVIPASVTVELDIATPNTIGVQDFTLGASARLIVRPGRAFTVIDDAQIAGVIEADGASSFTAIAPGAAITGTTARFDVSGGAVINVSGATHNVQNLGNATVYAADGLGTTLDLSAISSYNWLGEGGGSQTQRITASNGATIDLSTLESIAANVETQDRLIITQTAGGTVDLSGLTTISGAGEVRFATDSAAFALPALTTAANMTFDMIAGSTLELPVLATQNGGRYDVPASGTVSLASITSLNNAGITLGVGGTFTAPMLSNFDGSSLTLGAAQAWNAPSLESVDDSKFLLSGGASLTVADDAYTTDMSFGGTQTQFSADGAGTVLDLFTLGSYTIQGNSGGSQTQVITSSNGAAITLAGLTTITANAEAQDRLEIRTSSGGTIDLSTLQLVQGVTEVRFITDAASYTLPSLANANNVTYSLIPGATLTLPALVAQTSGRLDVPAGGTFNLPMLASLTNSVVTLGNGTFNAPALADIDNTQLAVTSGGVFASIDDVYDTNFQFGGTKTQFSADGAGSTLNLSLMNAYNVNGNSGGTQAQRIAASNGGSIDLSGLTSITLNSEAQDRLEFSATSSGTIDLSTLQSITGAGEARFITDTASFTLPALANANNTSFVLQPGSTLTLPALVAQTGGRFDVPAGGTFNLPVLASLTNSVVTVGTGVFSAPALSNIDNTELAVTSGGVFASSDDIYNTNLQFGGTKVQFSADGNGSALDLASMTAYLVNGNSGGTQAQQIRATNNAHIGFSGLSSIAVNGESQDRLEFVAQSGASIDLTALQSITGASATRFSVSGGGTINLGDLTVGQNVQFVVSDVTSTIDFAGSLIMNGGTASFASGSTLAIGEHFSHALTAETAFAASSAILLMTSPPVRAPGDHYLEVAGLDVGNQNPDNNGNFGFGQLVVGEPDGPATHVTLLDVVDNGNRGAGGEPEALYLFGLGGPEGLVINAGSTLLINNINVYYFDDGIWVHLNELFGPDEYVIPFDNGFVELPAPSTLTFVGAAALMGVRRRR